MTGLKLARLSILPIALAACVPAGPGMAPAVPAIRSERIPAPPPSRVTLIWQPGHYDWDGASYDWVGGEWVPRSGHGPLWQDGFWRREGGRLVWIQAHWM